MIFLESLLLFYLSLDIFVKLSPESTALKNEIGYESLLADFKRYQKRSPKGVSMRRNRNTINLQFKN